MSFDTIGRAARNGVARLDDVRLIAVASVAAVAGLYSLAWLPSPAWCIAPLLVCLRPFHGRIALAVVCVVVAWALVQAHWEQHRRLPPDQDGRIVWATGRVVGLPAHGRYRTRFEWATDRPARRLRLSWYGHPPAFAPGDCLRLKVKLSTPHGSADPGGFDYSGWLWRRGIDATGYVRDHRPCPRAPHAGFDRWRYDALQRLAPVLADAPMRGFIEAVSLGARQHITDAQWATLRATGTTHLVAISGLHIGLIAGLLFALVRWLALRSPAARHARRIAAACAMLGALAYAGLAGWALPTQRALIMAGALFLAVAAEREVRPERALAWAALVVIVWQPSAVLAPGFWLSFTAVAGLIWIATNTRGPAWKKALHCQIGLVLLLMPLTLWFFGQASLVAPLVNAVLIPLAGVVVPVVLVAVVATLFAPGLGGSSLSAVAAVLNHGWPVLAWIAHWPGAAIQHPLPGAWALLLAVAGLLTIAAPLPARLRALGLMLALPAVIGWMPADQVVPQGRFRLTALDVGQGLSNVIFTRHHTLVFDAGPAYRTGFNAGAAVVVPFLRNAGRTRVDRLLISHPDRDHIGGAAAIVRRLQVVDRLGAGSDRRCAAGQHWRWDGVAFEIVYPSPAEWRASRDRNQTSCVLWVHSPQASALLTGDIEAPSERELVDQWGGRLASDVLVVPHHGSNTSSTATLLDHVAPDVALISAGWHNRWGFPRSPVVSRYRSRGIALWDTATEGALRVTWPRPHEPKITGWRQAHRRFWQVPAPRPMPPGR